MITSGNRHAILAVLDESYFGGANFEVSFSVSGSTVLSVTFIPNPEFTFMLESTGYMFAFSVSPGPNLLTTERYGCGTVTDGIRYLKEWVERVKQEVASTNPLAREVARFREELELRISSMGEDMESFFTRTEAEELARKLANTIERLEKLQTTNEELAAATEKLVSTVAHLEQALAEVNKGTWFRMASGKLTSLAKSAMSSKEAREFALEAAKKILLEGPK